MNLVPTSTSPFTPVPVSVSVSVPVPVPVPVPEKTITLGSASFHRTLGITLVSSKRGSGTGPEESCHIVFGLSAGPHFAPVFVARARSRT